MILSIADRIRYMRDKMGMTQTDLAKRIGVSRNAVNAWEMSTSMPTLSNVVEMARIFHVSTDYLLSIDDTVKVDISELDHEGRELVFKLIDRLKQPKK